MEESFSFRLRKAIKDSHLYTKEIASKSGLKKRTIDGWLESDPSIPNAIDTYAIARMLGTVVEYLVDGEAGRDYVMQWASKQEGYRAPSRLTSIIEELEQFDETMLIVALHTLRGMPHHCPGPPAEALGQTENTG
jgi:hypothetical protein